MDAPNALRAVKDITKVAETMNFFIKLSLLGRVYEPIRIYLTLYTSANDRWI